MSRAMTLQEKIEQAFAKRAMPAVLVDPSVWQFDSDVDEALWFAGRNWRELTWEDWRSHGEAIFFFSPEAFSYYLPSLLILSSKSPDEWLYSADTLISFLDLSPTVDGWPEGFERRFLGLSTDELDVLKEWLLCMCEAPAYRGWGISASGPGDRFGRAFETIDCLQKEIRKRYPDRASGTQVSG